jgi:hypothetical protein
VWGSRGASKKGQKLRDLTFILLALVVFVGLPFKCLTATPHYRVQFEERPEYVILNGERVTLEGESLNIFMRPWPTQELRYKLAGQEEHCLVLHTSWSDDNSSGMSLSSAGVGGLGSSPPLPRTSQCPHRTESAD